MADTLSEDELRQAAERVLAGVEDTEGGKYEPGLIFEVFDLRVVPSRRLRADANGLTIQYRPMRRATEHRTLLRLELPRSSDDEFTVIALREIADMIERRSVRGLYQTHIIAPWDFSPQEVSSNKPF